MTLKNFFQVFTRSNSPTPREVKLVRREEKKEYNDKR